MEGMESPDPALIIAAPPDSQEVKWQVAFFALVPLALSAMTQPVGRVLDAPPELRFWLRSSPLSCAADMLCFIFRIAADYALQPEWSWRHVRAELSYRFRDEDWMRDGVKDFEKAALGRWLLLLLGGIPCQTIKLVAMRGIPVTQAAALVFFLALVFGEVVRVSAEAMLRSPGGRQRPVQVPPSALMRSTSLWLGERMFAVCQFWHAAIAADRLPEVTPTWPVAGPLLLVATLSGAFLTWDPLSTPVLSPQRWPVPYRTLLAMLLVLSVPSGWAPLFFEDLGISIIVSCTLIGIGNSALIAIWISSWLFVLDRLTWLSKTRAGRLFGVPRTPIEHECVLMFVVLLSVTIGSYAYVYDERETVNPEWVGIFG